MPAPTATASALLAEVIGFAGAEAILAPYGALQGVAVGAAVQALADAAQRAVRPCAARPRDRCLRPAARWPAARRGPDLRPRRCMPTRRRRCSARASTIRCRPACARSTPRSPSAKASAWASSRWPAAASRRCWACWRARRTADVNVIALVGERGREVREFLDESLGEEGLARSVVVVSTSDRPALERVRAAYAATAIAEGFRARGQARAAAGRFGDALRARPARARAVGAASRRCGAAIRRSVFAEMPRLFERAGNDAHGSITAFYTVLAEDDDNSDPVAEEVRSILDGHIVLSRQLAQAAHYPAIDVLGSASRVFTRVADPAHRAGGGAAARADGAPCRGRVPAARRRIPGRQRPAGRPRDRAHAGDARAADAALRRADRFERHDRAAAARRSGMKTSNGEAACPRSTRGAAALLRLRTLARAACARALRASAGRVEAAEAVQERQRAIAQVQRRDGHARARRRQRARAAPAALVGRWPLRSASAWPTGSSATSTA